MPTSHYHTRLLKGSALLPQMRTLVRFWRKNLTIANAVMEIETRRLLGAVSHARVQDIVQKVFVPRYVQSSPIDAWRLLRPLEDTAVSLSVLRPLYYFFAARADAFMGDFVRHFLFNRYQAGAMTVKVEDVLRFIAEAEADGRIPEPWSDSVRLRMAQHLLAALRDFGILEGRARKRIAAPYLPIVPFALLAFVLAQERRGAAALTHPDWQLFLLQVDAVERLFVEADRDRLLRYQAAGSIVRIEFPEEDVYAYSRFLAARPS